MRQVLNASKFYPQQETSLNANMNNLPCRSPDQGNVLLSFILYSNPVSLDVSAAFHCIKILESQRQFQNIVTFDFSKNNWQEHPLVIFNKSLSFGVKQSPPICEGVMRKVAQKASPYLKSIMLHSRVVDNIVWSQRSKLELLERGGGIKESHGETLSPIKGSGNKRQKLR